ncbi:unnamed protein product [Blepharisma stoltei]|uniref:RING-type domain-containing protein n=1 Tax=Blepharisma stoltei TaxID=1481888 RepID=A0AAU9JT18_9CILI|nr:unnamed protein product [Blepharisma stoltei]
MSEKSTITLDRFTCKVDEYFFCIVCDHIVIDPLECSNCENLACSECVAKIETCPQCNNQIKPRATSKYALQYYKKLTMKCINFNNGCTLEGQIHDVLEHQKSCDYEMFICSSPICKKKLLKIERYCLSPLVCSELCKKVCNFNKLLDTLGEEEILQAFQGFLYESKSQVIKERTMKIREEIDKLDKELAEKEKYEKEEESLLQELELRKENYHPGKWSIQGRYWTCCLSKNKLEIGCREL